VCLLAGSVDEDMTKIQVGDRAPDFSATTQDGQQVCLNDFLGKKALILFFYPKNGTPVCTKEACAFRDSYDQFLEAGAEVIGISSDSDQSHRAFADRHHLPFPLISDADGSLRTAFGVSKTLGLIPGRVTYVIDESGIVQLIFRAQFASEQHVRQALAAVRKT
jgi:thioredoxin-dependent peroxiredoxin